MDGRVVSFGPFRLHAGRRLLLEDDKPVRIGGRAFDILAALVERAGEVVSKDELIARAWPHTFVEESNLKMQVSALRRALDDGQSGHRYVVTVPGRGYNFVAPVSIEAPAAGLPSSPIARIGRHNLPLAATRMVGRDEALAAVVARLSRHQLVTIVGTGGIGKTTLALAVAEHLIADYEHGVWLVDLAPLNDARLVPSKVATTLNLEIHSDDPLPGLIANLGQKRMLLLLDNCDHVIDAAADLVAAIRNRAPGVNILATSREPLGVPGEHEYRLFPLGSPQPSPTLTAAEAALFPAVQLFVQRVAASVEDFALTDASARAVAEICSRLDGLPLAIEFAASRVAVLGVEDLAARLDDSLPLLGARHRTATARHRTMRAVLDWSYQLLNDDEQVFFRALGMFAGTFTVEAATAVAVDAKTPRIDAIDRLAELVAKSLVIADVSGAKPRFRLLETTRAYAVEKLDDNAERANVARRHAEHYLRLLKQAEIENGPQSTIEWLTDNTRELDDVSAAIDWAFSPGGNTSIGVALTIAAVPFWKCLSLFKQCRDHVRRALGALRAGAMRNDREEMMLQTELGATSEEASERVAELTRGLELAERLGDTEYRLRTLQGLFLSNAVGAQYRAALPFAEKFCDLAATESDSYALFVSEHVMGLAKHFLGDQIDAQRHLERVLTYHRVTDHRRDLVRFQIGVRVSASAFLARAQWLQGFSEQAVRTAERSIEEAQAIGHTLSLCYTLALAACPIALWRGDIAAAQRYTEILIDHSILQGTENPRVFASMFERIIRRRGGHVETGLRLPPAGQAEVVNPFFNLQLVTGLIDSAGPNTFDEPLAQVEARIERSEGGWLMPELLRIKAEHVLAQGCHSAAQSAERLFRQALDWARRQRSLAWELRAATSLARLLRRHGGHADAISVLQPVYDRFTEGFETADVIAARRYLNELKRAYSSTTA